MKSPDEIKKGLECCSEDGCKKCPYWEDCSMADGFSELAGDALALIQQLQAENTKKDETIQMLQDGNASLMRMIDEECEKTVQLEAERDAAVACIPRECKYCKHDGPLNAWGESECEFDSLFPNGCLNGNTRWEWRGVQKEATP